MDSSRKSDMLTTNTVAATNTAPENKHSFSASEIEQFNFLQILNDIYSQLSSQESKDVYSPSLITLNKSIELVEVMKQEWEKLEPLFNEPKSKKLLLSSKVSQSLTPEILKELFILSISQDLLANMNPSSQYDKWPLFKIFQSALSEGLTALKIKPIIKTNFDQSRLELDTDFPKQKENYAQNFPNIGNTLLELAKSLGINVDQPKYRNDPNNKSLDDQLNKIIDKITRLDSLKLSAEKKETEDFTTSREQKRIATASKLSILKALNASLDTPVIFNTYDTTESTSDETAIREQLRTTPLNKLVKNFLQNIDKNDVPTLHLLFDSDNLNYLIKDKGKFNIDGKEYSVLDFFKEVIKSTPKNENNYEQVSLAIELLDANLNEQLRIASELKPSSTEIKASPTSHLTDEVEFFREEKEYKIQLNKELEALNDARCDILYTKKDPTKNLQDLKFTNYSDKAFIRFEGNNEIHTLYYYDRTKNKLIDVSKDIDLSKFDQYIKINKIFKDDKTTEDDETAEIKYDQPKMLRKPVFAGALEMGINDNFTPELPAPSILLIPTNNVMAQLMTNKEKLGYETTVIGVCRGLSQMWTAAVLQGEEEKYNDRIQFINNLVYKKLIKHNHTYGELLSIQRNDNKYANENSNLSAKQDRVTPIYFTSITEVYNDILIKSRETQKKYLELETKIQNSEEFKLLSQEEKRELTKSDKYHSWIYNQLTQEEQQYYEMVPFLDSVALHQNPAILDKRFIQAGNVSLYEKYLSLTKGRKLGEENIVAIYSQPNIYKPQELETYLKQLHSRFNSLKDQLKDKENTQTTINLESNTHSISLKYNPKTDDWTIADPNRLPPYTTKIEDLTAAVIRDLIIYKDNDAPANVQCTIFTTTNNPMLESINRTFTAFKAETKFPTNILERTTYGSKIENNEIVTDYSVQSNLLMDAIQYGDLETIKQLMEQARNFGEDFNKRQLLFSLINRDIKTLKLFLDKKNELKLNLDITHQDKNGRDYTALSYLVLDKNPDFEKIAALINAGADIWKHGLRTNPPFVSLAYRPNALKQFADLIKADNAGNTLLHNAVRYAISVNKYQLSGTSQNIYDYEIQTSKTVISEEISDLYKPKAIGAIISLLSSEGQLFDKTPDPTHSEYFKKASSLLYQENNKGLKPLDLASEDFLRRFIDELIVYKPVLSIKDEDEDIEIEKISLEERVNKIKLFSTLAANNGDIKFLKAILDHEHKDEHHSLAKLTSVNVQQILSDILNSSLEVAIKNGQTELIQWISLNVKNYLEANFLNKFANLDSAIEESRKNKELFQIKPTQDKQSKTESKSEEKLQNLDTLTTQAEIKSDTSKVKELTEKREKAKVIREGAEKKLEKLFASGVKPMEVKSPEPSTAQAAEAAKILTDAKEAELAAQVQAEAKSAELAAQAQAEAKSAELAAQAQAEAKAAELVAQAQAEAKAAELAAQVQAEAKAAEEAQKIKIIEAEAKKAKESEEQTKNQKTEAEVAINKQTKTEKEPDKKIEAKPTINAQLEKYNFVAILNELQNKLKDSKSPPIEGIEKHDAAVANIEAIKKICTDKYKNQSFYGSAALNRKILLDPEICKLLTPDTLNLIFYLQTQNDKSIEIKRSGGPTTIANAIFYGLADGLDALKMMPNNEHTYGLIEYSNQKKSYEENSTKVLNNILKITNNLGIPINSPQFSESNLVEGDRTLSEIFNTIKGRVQNLVNNGISNTLLFVPVWTPDDMRAQAQSGLDAVRKAILGENQKFNSISLQEFATKFIENDNALLNGNISHLFYDRAHIEAGLAQDTKWTFKDGEHSLTDVLQAMVTACESTKKEIANNQFNLRFKLVEKHLTAVENDHNIINDAIKRLETEPQFKGLRPGIFNDCEHGLGLYFANEKTSAAKVQKCISIINELADKYETVNLNTHLENFVRDHRERGILVNALQEIHQLKQKNIQSLSKSSTTPDKTTEPSKTDAEAKQQAKSDVAQSGEEKKQEVKEPEEDPQARKSFQLVLNELSVMTPFYSTSSPTQAKEILFFSNLDKFIPFFKAIKENLGNETATATFLSQIASGNFSIDDFITKLSTAPLNIPHSDELKAFSQEFIKVITPVREKYQNVNANTANEDKNVADAKNTLSDQQEFINGVKLYVHLNQPFLDLEDDSIDKLLKLHADEIYTKKDNILKLKSDLVFQGISDQHNIALILTQPSKLKEEAKKVINNKLEAILSKEFVNNLNQIIQNAGSQYKQFQESLAESEKQKDSQKIEPAAKVLTDAEKAAKDKADAEAAQKLSDEAAAAKAAEAVRVAAAEAAAKAAADAKNEEIRFVSSIYPHLVKLTHNEEERKNLGSLLYANIEALKQIHLNPDKKIETPVLDLAKYLEHQFLLADKDKTKQNLISKDVNEVAAIKLAESIFTSNISQNKQIDNSIFKTLRTKFKEGDFELKKPELKEGDSAILKYISQIEESYNKQLLVTINNFINSDPLKQLSTSDRRKLTTFLAKNKIENWPKNPGDWANQQLATEIINLVNTIKIIHAATQDQLKPENIDNQKRIAAAELAHMEFKNANLDSFLKSVIEKANLPDDKGLLDYSTSDYEDQIRSDLEGFLDTNCIKKLSTDQKKKLFDNVPSFAEGDLNSSVNATIKELETSISKKDLKEIQKAISSFYANVSEHIVDAKNNYKNATVEKEKGTVSDFLNVEENRQRLIAASKLDIQRIIETVKGLKQSALSGKKLEWSEQPNKTSGKRNGSPNDYLEQLKSYRDTLTNIKPILDYHSNKTKSGIPPNIDLEDMIQDEFSIYNLPHVKFKDCAKNFKELDKAINELQALKEGFYLHPNGTRIDLQKQSISYGEEAKSFKRFDDKQQDMLNSVYEAIKNGNDPLLIGQGSTKSEDPPEPDIQIVQKAVLDKENKLHFTDRVNNDTFRVSRIPCHNSNEHPHTNLTAFKKSDQPIMVERFETDRQQHLTEVFKLPAGLEQHKILTNAFLKSPLKDYFNEEFKDVKTVENFFKKYIDNARSTGEAIDEKSLMNYLEETRNKDHHLLAKGQLSRTTTKSMASALISELKNKNPYKQPFKWFGPKHPSDDLIELAYRTLRSHLTSAKWDASISINISNAMCPEMVEALMLVAGAMGKQMETESGKKIEISIINDTNFKVSKPNATKVNEFHNFFMNSDQFKEGSPNDRLKDLGDARLPRQEYVQRGINQLTMRP